MKKIFLTVLFFLFVLVMPTYAVTETDGDLQVTYDETLFPSTIIWYPGLTVQKSFTVKNIGGVKHTASVKATNTSQIGDIASLYFFKITEGATTRYGGANDKTMKNFWDNSEVNLSDINSNNSTNYDISVTMPATSGNDFQGKNAKFDLVIGFVGTPSQVTVSDGGGAVTGAVATPEATLTITQTPIPTGQVQGETTQKQGFNKILLLSIPMVFFIIILIKFFLKKQSS